MIRYFKRIFWDIMINSIGKSRIFPARIRYFIYKMVGLKSKSCAIESGCTFNGRRIEIEEGTFINHNVFFDCTSGDIRIGKNVSIAFQASIYTATHDMGPSEKRAGTVKYLSVEIGDGCWIGAKATILPGVKIGNGCMIATGSLVNKDCEPNGLYAGVPAKRIKDLPV